jgi:hypothetical protein
MLSSALKEGKTQTAETWSEGEGDHSFVSHCCFSTWNLNLLKEACSYQNNELSSHDN